MTDVLELAYRATTADELEMARTLLLQRMNGTPAGQWPERYPEELGLLEQIEFMQSQLGLIPPPEEQVDTGSEEVSTGETLPPDSTEARLRDQLTG